MAISSDGYPRLAHISPRVRVADHLDSTNAALREEAESSPETHPHLSVVVTRDQRAGRGRLGRTWVAPPGTAIALSILLRTEAIDTDARGWIPLLTGAAVARAVAAQLPDHEVSVKWPNDVLVDGLKLSGILAEVSPKDPNLVIVGVGVNTTMVREELPVPTATSFAAVGAEADEDRLLADIVRGVRDTFAELAVGGPAAIREDVLALCSTVGADVSVSLPDGTHVEGRVSGLDDAGRLVVEQDGVPAVIAAGDVVHVR